MACIACQNLSGQTLPPIPVAPPNAQVCACCGQAFTVLQGTAIDQTVIASLTGAVDLIRDIKTQLGARPYTVALIWTRWSGGERGLGMEEVTRVVPVLPTPKVSDLTSVGTSVTPVGTEEEGGIRVTEISPRFTEDTLNGIDDDGTPVPQDQNFYWEIVFLRSDGPGVRRRFTPKGTPSYNPLKFGWTVDLQKQYDDRARNTDPDG